MPVPDLQALLKRLCSDLSQIEHELKQVARQQAGRPAEIRDEQLLAEAKSAVDRIRHLLWPYVEAAAKRAAGIDETLQKYRMERVTAMLHDLTDRVAEPELAAIPEAQSFFSDIQKIATTAVEKHLERVASAPSDRRLPSSEPVLN
jgi:hypothetical protein